MGKLDKQSAVCLVGAFPPPTHGMSLVNHLVNRRLNENGIGTVVIDVSPGTHRRDIISRLARVPLIAGAMWRYLKLLSAGRATSVYLGVSGSWGQIYDVVFVAIGRLFHRPLFLHHHSFAYINKKSWLMALLVKVGGASATHIALCDTMAQALRALYGTANEVLIISNAAVIGEGQGKKVARSGALKTIGFLGNISSEKGILDFLDIVSRLTKKGLDINAKIVGPFQDIETEHLVSGRLRELSSVEYLGAKYGRDKLRFYESIDVLLFPTRYFNEAEPLTIHEAMSNGVVVIARNRGCIASLISPAAGLVVDQNEGFVDRAVAQICAWHNDREQFREASRAAIKMFFATKTANIDRYGYLLQKLCRERPKAAS